MASRQDTGRCMSEFKDTGIAKKCEIIPRNPRNLEDFLYTLPVSKVNSTIVYRNMYCGLCNGEAEEDLVQWTIELTCNSRRDMQMASFDELLVRTDICSFVALFYPGKNQCDHNLLSVEYVLFHVGIIVSMFCLLLTVLTYFLFKSLRTTPGKNNMFLSINLLIAQALFQFGAGQRALGLGCVVVGALIHYFWLSAVVWMNICSFHMFRVFSSLKAKTMSSQRDEKRDMVTYIIYSVLAPLVIVGLNILVNLVTSEWSHVGYGGCVCYISSSHMIMFTFAIPIAFLLSLNLIFFVIVIISIRRTQHSKLSSNQDQITIVVYLKLSCLTGASWIFGFLYMLINLDVLGYIFIVLTAGEGIFIFLSFICSKRVLKLYRGLLGYSGPSESEHSSRTTMSSVSNVGTKQNVQNNCQQSITRM
ncbi:latrophilin receptor-like protein A [Mizuhopecten yessoensis]|uniref:latrophilin receptor-like protein A n=1 Tax=Mizuhopecten yessoensis TaxID=6573 RepID=UPI000B45879B|nr:latrophilin receptor-like protein A [Mizuhopecten yessoensis]